MFTRACWELAPVPDVEWSEDAADGDGGVAPFTKRVKESVA